MSDQEKEENKSPEGAEKKRTSTAEVSKEGKQATGESKSPEDTKNERTNSAVVHIGNKEATGESESPEGTKNERTSSVIVNIEDKHATGESKSPEHTKNDHTSSAEVSIENKEATGKTKSPESAKNERTSLVVVNIEDKHATGESKSPEHTKNERTSSVVVSIEDKQATGESFETTSHKSTRADDAVKEDTVIYFKGEKEADPNICSVKGVQNKKILQKLTGKQLQLLKYGRPRFWLYEEWSPTQLLSAYLPSLSDYLPALPWPLSSPEEAKAAVRQAKATTTTTTTSIFDYFGAELPPQLPKGPRILDYGHLPTGPALDYPSKHKDIRNETLQPTFAALLGMILVVFTCLIVISSTNLQDDLFCGLGFLSAGACMAVILLQYFGFCFFPFLNSFPVNYAFLFITASCFGWVLSVFLLYLVPNLVIGVVATLFLVYVVCFVLSYTRVDFRKRCYLLVLLFFDILAGALISCIYINFNPHFKWYKGVALVGATIPVITMMLVELQMVLKTGSYELGEGEHAFLAFLIFTCYIDLNVQILHSIVVWLGAKLGHDK